MHHQVQRAAFLRFLVACAFTALAGCKDSIAPPAPDANIASVIVNADQPVTPVGKVAWVSFTALDAAGNALPVPSVSWTSLTPNIASVSPSGAVDAVSTGVAIIEGRVGKFSARAELTLVPGIEEASHNFDDGTIGPYNDRSDLTVDFPLDPTESGRGNVARFHYQGSNGDVNRSLEYRYPRSWGQPIYFKGEFFLPVADLGANNFTRKLIYWQSHRNFSKYPAAGGLASGRTVVAVAGTDLVVDAVYNPAGGKNADGVRTWAVLAPGMQGNRWYTLEVFQRMESALGRADGVLEIKLDGALVFAKSTMRWSDPGWSDIYFERFLVGDQVNLNKGSFDEFRYWDNVQFSTRVNAIN